MDDKSYIKCPVCDGEIKVGAIKCRHCKSDLAEAGFASANSQNIASLQNENNTWSEDKTDVNNVDTKEEASLEIAAIDDPPKMETALESSINDNAEAETSNKTEFASNEELKTNTMSERSFVMEKIKYLGYAAWTYLVLSLIGGLYLWEPLTWAYDEIGVAIIFALMLQAVIISGLILVFCDMASNVNAIKNKLVGDTSNAAEDNDIEVVKKEEF